MFYLVDVTVNFDIISQILSGVKFTVKFFALNIILPRGFAKNKEQGKRHLP